MSSETIASAGMSNRLRQSVLALWEGQREHPFVAALGDGSLPRANFEFYIRQDALFLDVLAKCFAYAFTRTSDHAEMEHFGKFQLDTLMVEAALHRQYAQRFGLTPDEMAATPMAPTNYAYTRHLLSIATTGTLPEIIVSMLPCAWIYAETGTFLVNKTPPSADHPYAEWLATYADPEFDAVGAWLRQRLDLHAAELREAESARLFEIFHLSTCYEWLFWEMAWRQEGWPA